MLPAQTRRAFTLIEIMMVLLILVVAGAVVAPNVLNMLRRQRLKSAAESMRIAWSRAHVKAMKTGRIQVFRYELNGNQFSLQPWTSGDEATEGESEATNGFGGTVEAPDATVETKKLEDGITFAAGEAKFQARASAVETSLQNAGTAEGGQWSRPILFYPDGSATDAYVIVSDLKQDAYRINLRGLTGTSQVSDEKKLDDLLAAIQPGEVTP
ncbi:pilus assembly FimT family protein [Anatilimnocola floriformis]|uniref:pilus assembly FimT family protein n=1 Tax=Anatilimnocola floriformis TaxID=2948575 RepID=UPI0020C3B18C|nr:prepilin-type N-terminal cleavage/methylation domain-containing protein [Anatilimnocola floriformis]